MDFLINNSSININEKKKKENELIYVMNKKFPKILFNNKKENKKNKEIKNIKLKTILYYL